MLQCIVQNWSSCQHWGANAWSLILSNQLNCWKYIYLTKANYVVHWLVDFCLKVLFFFIPLSYLSLNCSLCWRAYSICRQTSTGCFQLKSIQTWKGLSRCTEHCGLNVNVTSNLLSFCPELTQTCRLKDLFKTFLFENSSLMSLRISLFQGFKLLFHHNWLQTEWRTIFTNLLFILSWIFFKGCFLFFKHFFFFLTTNGN